MDVLLSPALATGVKAMFAGDPAARGMTLDLAMDPDAIMFDLAGRYAAVIRKPSGFYVLGGFPTADAADAAIADFWSDMAALLAPARGAADDANDDDWSDDVDDDYVGDLGNYGADSPAGRLGTDGLDND